MNTRIADWAELSTYKPDYDGGLTADQIYVTSPLDDDITDAVNGWMDELKALGFDTGAAGDDWPNRLMNDANGNARWAADDDINDAPAEVTTHPAHWLLVNCTTGAVETEGGESTTEEHDREDNEQAEDEEMTDADDDQASDSVGLAPHHSNPHVGGIGPLLNQWPLIDIGVGWGYQTRRKLNIVNDDIADIQTYPLQYIAELYNAARDLPATPSTKQQQMIVVLECKLKKIDATQRDAVVQSACATVIKCIINLHTKGDHLRADQFKLSPADKNMTAIQRFGFIRDTVEDTKHIVVDMLTGLDKIAVLVAGPEAYRKAKYANVKNNERRKKILDKGMKVMGKK